MSAPFTGPYDCDAHRSINLSQRQIANTQTISKILALLFCKVDGLGAALVPGEDGNRHAVRLHAQDGALGRSGHLLHREPFAQARGNICVGHRVTRAGSVAARARHVPHRGAANCWQHVSPRIWGLSQCHGHAWGKESVTGGVAPQREVW